MTSNAGSEWENATTVVGDGTAAKVSSEKDGADDKESAIPKHGKFHIDLNDALTPDPGTEDMFNKPKNKFAFSPGQLSKLLDPKSLNAFLAMGGLAGLEKGLRTDIKNGLSSDEDILDGSVAFEDVAAKGAPKYGALGDTAPVPSEEKSAAAASGAAHHASTQGFSDRQDVFNDNR
jgi:P-type Ca2+ transporter type 2C